MHRAGEQAIRDSGIGCTFLRPTAYMSNALNWAGMIAADQVVHAPFAAGRAAVADPADIAAVAAACLTHDGHNHQVYELTGPEPLSPPDQIAILSQVLGRDLHYAEADPADMLAQMVSYGTLEELAHAIVEQFRSTLEPYNSESTGDITAVTSRPARSFTDWAHAHRTELLTPESTRYAAPTIEDYAEKTRQTVTAWSGMSGLQGGDPAKLAQALIRLASQDEPPLRWAAGADAVAELEQKARRLLAQADAYRELSSSLAHEDTNA